MSCTKVAVPNMDVLCIVVANHVIITCTDVAVIDVHVVSPDRDTICVMRRLFSLGFRRRVIDGYIMNCTIAGTIAVTQGDVDPRSILNLEIANQESAAFLETDHRSRIEFLLVVASLPPAGSLTVNNRSFTFTLYNNVALVLVLATDKDCFVIWCLSIFHELQGCSCAKVENGFRLDAEYFGLACHLVYTTKHPCTGRDHDHTTCCRHSIKCFLDSLGVIFSRCRSTIIFDIKCVCRSDGRQLWQFYGSPSFRSFLCVLLGCDTSESLCFCEHWQSHERSQHDCLND